MNRVTASTRVAAVIGDPVRHSLSPTIHNAAFEATGIDGVYVALPVPAGKAANAIAAMRTFEWYGLSVTMPHKQAVAAACDELTDAATELDAVNCVFWRDDTIVGDNTDGHGFVAGLGADFQRDLNGVACVVVGAGGAAKAVIRELDGRGASVAVMNRSSERAAEAAALTSRPWVVSSDDLSAFELVVNATPLGMADTPHTGQVPFDVDSLGSGAFVADLIYHPAETPLLAAARTRGLRGQNGLPMLIHQAAAQFEHWTGAEAPVDVMAEAVAAELC